MNACRACQKVFATPYSARRHERESCKQLKTHNLADENKHLRETLLCFQKKIDKLQGELNLQRELTRHAEARADKLEKHIIEESKKPKHVTNNNTTINLAVFDLTRERAERIAQQEYSEEMFLKGPQETIKFIVEKQLTNDRGKPMVMCSDRNRRVFRGINPDGSKFIDHGGRFILKLVNEPMKMVVKDRYEMVSKKEPDRDDELSEKKIEHYKVLQSDELAKQIAYHM